MVQSVARVGSSRLVALGFRHLPQFLLGENFQQGQVDNHPRERSPCRSRHERQAIPRRSKPPMNYIGIRF
jgi:hypothetical protein